LSTCKKGGIYSLAAGSILGTIASYAYSTSDFGDDEP
jgi:hypothetical protein